ncbi:uncharacterized protein N7515_000893 [Penicillium bovifimosum]|uniref:DUF8035 domain-containing protein n=1 Tax=Penicillium bovifimosum TaxID=126998 RepID=A0A9W9HGX3_9EURO|nr:uncharacterized protein N7515_000893 [Penicillium bovifimosum]KAJ5146329.1 hypothetical protein N7515_000893 [Penicillium bovifimosum]
MSRRVPRREYYEEDELYEMDREHERYDRPPRRPRYSEVDEEYFRRRSEPLVDDMERMHIRERPRRDFMETGFAPRERDELVLRRSRELESDSESESDSLGRMSRDHRAFERQPVSRSRRHPREVEKTVVEERESSRGARRHPLDVEEDDIMDDREDYRVRRRRPERDRKIEEDFIVDERERRPERRHRSRRVVDEDLLVERERDRGSERRRHSEPQFDDDPFIMEERHRSGRRHRREVDDDDIIFEGNEPRSPSRHRSSKRHPERRSEDDILFEKRERRQHRRRPEREIEEDLWIEGAGKHRHRHPVEGEVDEELAFRRKEKEDRPLRRGWDSELDMRSRDRRLEFEEEEIYHRPRPRGPPPRRVEVEEVLDDVVPERHRGPIGRPKRDIQDEEMIIRLKDKGLRPVDLAEEDGLVIRERREKRRSIPSEDLERELRGSRRGVREESPLDADVSTRSQFDAKSSARDLDDVGEGFSIRKSKEKLPSRPPSPSMASIHVPAIHQDVFTHHRHIDHGFEEGPPPRAPSPELPSPVGSFDEIDIKHRKMRGGRISEEKIALRHRDSIDTLAPEDSISPTSQAIFTDPWEREATSASRSCSNLLDKEKDLPSMAEIEKEILLESARAADNAPRSADDWSVVHAPSKEEAIEMSGALGDLDVIEVKPRRASVEEVNLGRIAQQVTETKETRNDRWTEIAKKLVVREAIEQMDYEYEETKGFYYIFSYLSPDDIDDLVELSDEIRSARRRRIQAIQRERASISLPSTSHIRSPPVGMPPRARMAERRMQGVRDRLLSKRL